MNESAANTANSAQPAQIKDLDQQIASKRARLAEQERLLHSARLRFRSYSNAGLFAFENRERRAALWHKIVEQPHHKHLDTGQLPDGSIVDLVLDPQDELKIRFICYEPPESKDGEPQIACSEILADNHHAYLPPEVDPNLLKSIRMPVEAVRYESLNQLISAISTLILRCVALSEIDARLLAHFVLATWLIDRLPIAPYLALVGPPQSGKTTLLRVLHLLCRRALFASDATSVTLLHACHQLHPTLLIDETSSIENPVALRRLLRIGNTPGSLVLRHKQSWNIFGAKVICWRELPDDAALNSRCIILPMHGVNDPALRLPDDPEIVSAADTLQSQLLYYRLANYERVATPAINEAAKTLPPRSRELYLALSTPCADNEQSRNILFDYFRNYHVQDGDSLSPAEQATLVALFHLVHLPEHRSQLLTKDVAHRANRYLRDEREHDHLPIRRTGAILSGFSFAQRRRTRKGWALLLEKHDQRRLHTLAERYGIDQLRDDMPGFTACHLCPDVPPTERSLAVGVVTG